MYIPKELRDKVNESVGAVNDMTSLTYTVSTFMLAMWNQAPNDDTLAVLTKELVIDPKHSKFIANLRAALADSLTVAEIYTACRMAYDEFYQRVGRLHRALQCRNNGDLEGYTQALGPLLADLGQAIKKDSASQLILPGGKQ